jgi:hypothetical protein
VVPEGLAKMPPGPDLALALAGLDLARCTSYDLHTVVAAHGRQLAHDQALMWAALRETAHADSDKNNDPSTRVRVLDEFSASQLAFTLTQSRQAVSAQLDLADTLLTRFPKVFEALKSGRIDRLRAEAFVRFLEGLSDDLAQRIVDRLIGLAETLTAAQLRKKLRYAVMAVDPDQAKQRQQHSIANRRMSLQEFTDGTAELVFENLPPHLAVAAVDRVKRIARAAKAAGDPRSLNQLRVDAALYILCGIPFALHPPADPFTRSADEASLEAELKAGLDLNLNTTDDDEDDERFPPQDRRFPRSQPKKGFWARPTDNPNGQPTPNQTKPNGQSTPRPANPNEQPGPNAQSDPNTQYDPNAQYDPSGQPDADATTRNGSGSSTQDALDGLSEPQNTADCNPDPLPVTTFHNTDSDTDPAAEQDAGPTDEADPTPLGTGTFDLPDSFDLTDLLNHAGSLDLTDLLNHGDGGGSPTEHQNKNKNWPADDNGSTYDRGTAAPGESGSKRNQTPVPIYATPGPIPPDPIDSPLRGPDDPRMCSCGGFQPAPRRGQVDVHVELSTLAFLNDHPALLPEWGPVIAEIARQVAFDRVNNPAWKYTVTDDRGIPIHHGPIRRRPTATEKAFVKTRDKTCVAPGCTRPARWCDDDHRHGWANDGPSHRGNLENLCRHHHRLRHERGFILHPLVGGGYVWEAPNGKLYLVLPNGNIMLTNENFDAHPMPEYLNLNHPDYEGLTERDLIDALGLP